MKFYCSNSKSKRLFSLLLTIVLVFSLISIPTSADTAYPIYNQYIDSDITRISVCSDLHLDEVAQNRGKFASYLTAVDTYDPQMLIFCGDPCTSGYNAPQTTDYGGIFSSRSFANVYDEIRAAVAHYVGADKPVVFVAGNHDYDVNPSPYPTYSGFDSYYGLVPTENFDIFLMGAHNNTNWSFSPAQMTALEEYLDSRADSDKLLLVPAHFPIDDAGGRGDATNAADLKSLLSAYDLPIVYMWGHNHSEADKPYSDMARILKEYPISYTTVNAGAINYRAPADTTAWRGLNLTVDLVNNQLNYTVIGNSSEGPFRVIGTHTQALPTSEPFENAQTPVIQTQPGNTTVTVGAPVSLSVVATVGRGALSYQWFVNTVNANSGGAIIPGAVAASYSPPTSALGQNWYYCEVTNTDDTATTNKTAVIASQTASVQVQATQQTGWDGAIASSYGGGSGSAADPWLINNAAQLARLAQETNAGTNYSGVYFRQTADIDLGGHAWTPVGGYISSSSDSNRVFAGTYDGGGKLVRGLHIDLTAEGSSSLPKTYGLFGYVSGTIMNVGVVDADVSFINTQTGSSNTNAYVGIIAGYLGNNSTPAAKILNSFATGSAYAQTAAGSSTTVLCCAGGLTGYVYSGEIRNSYASATVTNRGSFSSQYSGYGGVVGQIRSGETFANVSWNNELTTYGAASSSSAVTGLTGKTTATLKSTDYLADLNSAAADQTGWLEWMADTTTALNGGYPLHLRQVNVIVDAQVPVILTQPAARTVAPNGAASLSVVAAVDRGSLSYQWYSNSVDSNDGGFLIPGAIAATYSPPTDTLGQIWYYCIITNTDIEATGNQTAFDVSNAAGITVSEAPPVWDGSIASSYGGGSGTEASPWLITNAAELARLAQETNADVDFSGKFFRQTADIDLGELAWTPIGGYISSAATSSNRTFAGTYNGGGYLVRGLKIDILATGSTSLVKSYGLFGHVSGTIMNLGVVDADVAFVNTKSDSGETNAYVGLIAGYLSSDSSPAAKILNSFATGNASASTSLNSSGVLCCAGGLTGYVYGGEIRNSYASAAVTISGSYSASSSGYGGVFGQSRSRSGVPNVYENAGWNSDLTAYGAAGKSDPVAGLTGKTTSALKASGHLVDL
ncbi:MAG: metallophosphoesterase, partial [Clostridiaceae bacterium]|nr:metallophosphoesterase [Clostridiaceae bacterium]